MLKAIGDLEAVLLTGQLAEFMVAYQRKTRGAWRSNDGGQVVMVLAASMAAVMALATVRAVGMDVLHLWPAVPEPTPVWFQALRAAVFLSVPVAVARQRWMLGRVQRRGRRSDDDSNEMRGA